MRLTKPNSIEEHAKEVVREVRLQAQYRKNRWCHDAWETIMEAIEDQSPFMRDAGPCAVRIYQRLTELAFAYLAAKPNIANMAELHAGLQHDVEVLGLRFTVMNAVSESMNLLPPFTEKERQIVAVAIVHLGHLAKQLEKQLSDTS